MLALIPGVAPVAYAAGAPGEAAATETSSAAANAVGHWIYNSQGAIVGSVRSLGDGGRTAVIMVGSYFQQGSHEARVPASAISIVDGRVTLQSETVQALNAPVR